MSAQDTKARLGLYLGSLWHWYVTCAADEYRTEAEDALLRRVGEALKEAGVDLGIPPVPRAVPHG